jgi:NAD(P)-dependent dehydrogenase (short-subunit alcohol dehydrogenase family)
MRFVVTGVSRGIGAEVADRLLAAGHQVYGVVRPGRTRIDGLAGFVEADLAHPEDLDRAVRAFADDLGPIDGLVHSAGIVRGSTLTATSAEDFNAQFTVNVTAVAELTRLFLPGLRRAGGTVVLLNSMSGIVPRTPLAAYGASKFALRSYAESLRLEEPEIRVSSIYPGRVATDMQAEVRALEQADYRAADYLRPSTVADLIITVLMLPADGVVLDLSLRPRHPPSAR